ALPVTWKMLAMRTVGDAIAFARNVRPFLARFDYASLSPAGSTANPDTALVFRAFSTIEPEPSLLAELDTLFGLDAPSCDAVFDDARRGISKRARFDGDRLSALRLTNEIAAGAWLKDLLVRGTAMESASAWLFAPWLEMPAGGAMQARGRVVCSCHDVAEVAITACFRAGDSLPLVQQKLKCGTGCGSCVPELRRMARQHAPFAEAMAAE
ncbi:MAG: (2Fe-2S)-binding protein, partial [Betaproteobacteria bacterium]